MLAAGTTGSNIPPIAVFIVSLTSLVIALAGAFLSNRAQNKTAVLQTKAEKVKAEQHMIEILQNEGDAIRKNYATDLANLKQQYAQDIVRVRQECVDRINTMKQQLQDEREAHDRTRHRYLEDMTAMRLIIRDEIAKTAAEMMDVDVRDLLREATPDDRGGENPPREEPEDGSEPSTPAW